MKTLNLVNQEQSQIKYRISKFPDGQQNLNIEILNIFDRLDIIEESVQIKSRLNNWSDLELIVCAVASLKELEVKEIYGYFPYILGARSDRKFEKGGNNYLKDVICPVLNSLGLESITCLDPHSNCLEMGLKGFKSVSNAELVQFAIFDLYKDTQKSLKDQIIISPDAGASHKIYKLMKELSCNAEVITCSKDRDTEGKLTETNINWNSDLGKYSDKDFIIIDDICDGGKTFTNISEVIKAYFPKNKIYLIVTHGIFSKGFIELFQYFDGIYCTNSYSSDLSNDLSKFNEDVIYMENNGQRVKQLNVF